MKLIQIYKRLKKENEEHLKFQEDQGWTKFIACNGNAKPGGLGTLALAFEVWRIERKYGEQAFREYRDLVLFRNEKADHHQRYRQSDPSQVTLNAACSWKIENQKDEFLLKKQIFKKFMFINFSKKGFPTVKLEEPFYFGSIPVRYGWKRYRLPIWYLWDINSWYSEERLKEIEEEDYS